MTPFAMVLVALASFRLTRLIADDDITEPIRARIVRRVGADSKLATLIECPFCVGVYVTLGVLAVWLHGGRVGYWLVVCAAAIGAQALLASWEGAPGE